MRSLMFAAVALVALACGTRAGPAHDLVAVPDDTTLGPGDQFEVRVYGEEDLSNAYRVAQDGTIDFPLIGRIEVGGREPTEVADVISGQLRERDILVDPQVSVLVEEYNSKTISVMGAVTNTGSFPMRAGLTVAQAISLAGGFTPLAARNDTVVTRRVDGELRRYRIKADDVIRGEAEDFALRAGDILYVPERLF